MKNKEKISLLGLGSIVTINDELVDKKEKFVVVARAILRDKEKISGRYLLAPHPTGDIPSQELIKIVEDQITDIVFQGYSDKDDEKFLEEMIKKSNTIKSAIPKKNENPKKTEQKKDEIKINSDPFYKFR